MRIRTVSLVAASLVMVMLAAGTVAIVALTGSGEQGAAVAGAPIVDEEPAPIVESQEPEPSATPDDAPTAADPTAESPDTTTPTPGATAGAGGTDRPASEPTRSPSSRPSSPSTPSSPAPTSPASPSPSPTPAQQQPATLGDLLTAILGG